MRPAPSFHFSPYYHVPFFITDERSKRLKAIPGIGPFGAALLIMKTPAPELFQSGREFAAWIGLTPKDHSTGGKLRLGGITRAALVVGATSVIQHARRTGKASVWLTELLKRKPSKLAAIALANKMARIAWKIMVSSENIQRKIGSRIHGRRCMTIAGIEELETGVRVKLLMPKLAR